MNLFGRAKKSDASSGGSSSGGQPNTSMAISKLRDASETLQKREEHLKRKVTAETKQAIDFNKQGKKREALTCIKRRKMYEKQMDQIGNQRITLETQQLALENMNLTKETLAAQQEAARVMHQQTQALGGADKVDELMDNIEEGLQDANEIGEAMSRPVATPGMEGMDDDELLAELDELGELDATDELAEQMTHIDVAAADTGGFVAPAAPTNKPMPSAPTGKVMTEEEKELAELEASMAM